MEKLSQFTGLPTSRYHQVNQDPEENKCATHERSLAETEQLRSGEASDALPRKPWSSSIKYALSGLLFILYSGLLVVFASSKVSDNECGRQVSLWCKLLGESRSYEGHTFFTDAQKAPLNEAIDYYELDLNNEFDHETPYRGPPTPELEEA